MTGFRSPGVAISPYAARRVSHRGRPRVDPEDDLLPLRARRPQEAPPLRLEHRDSFNWEKPGLRRPNLPIPASPARRPASPPPSGSSSTTAPSSNEGLSIGAPGPCSENPMKRRLRRSGPPSPRAGFTAVDVAKRQLGGALEVDESMIRKPLSDRRSRCWRLASAAAAQAPRQRPCDRTIKPRLHHRARERERRRRPSARTARRPYLSQDAALAGRLPAQLLRDRPLSLDNYIAMVSGQAPEPRDPGRLPGLRRLHARARRPRDGQVHRPGVRLSGRRSRRSPTSSRTRGYTWKGYMEDMARRPRRAPSLPPPDVNSQDDTQTRRGRRPVRGAPQPVRLLPLDHRLPDLRRRTTSTSAHLRDRPGARRRRRRTTRSSPRTSATTATTRRASTASRAACETANQLAAATTCRRSSARPPSRTTAC